MSEFEQILDECLIALQVTGNVEAALAAYPEEAEALRPLLLAAAAVQNSPRPLARPAGVSEGRQRIQAAFAARQESGRFASQPAVFGFLSVAPAWWRGRSIFKELLRMNSSLRPVFTFLAVFIIGGTFLVATSGNSLPGEPLYPVKQLWEAARLALTADPQARQLIEEALRQERIEELRALIESGREQLFTFEARLEAVRANDIVVDGFTVLVNRQTVWQDQPAVGQMVRLEVHIQGDGTITARRIQLASAWQVITPTPTAKATTCNNFMCETVTPSATEATPEVTATSTPAGCNFGACPTETGEPTEPATVTPSPTGATPNVTATVCNFGFCGTVTATPTAAGQATATATPVPTWTPTACNNPGCGEPTDEPTPPPNDTATPSPLTVTPSVTPACPPVGCNEPTPTPSPAVTASSTAIPTATPTAADATATPTPCNGGACEPPTATPGATITSTPTAAPTDTPEPLPSPTQCNWGMCGGPSEPTATPNP